MQAVVKFSDLSREQIEIQTKLSGSEVNRCIQNKDKSNSMEMCKME